VWAARLSPGNLVAALENDSGPPLFYLLEKPFVRAGERFLSSDVGARFLPFLAALAILAGVRSLPTPGAKVRFVFLASLSPLLLLYSAEARAYAVLASLVLALFILATASEEALVTLAVIALLSAALLFTHYLAIFAVVAVAAVAAAEKRRRSALSVVVGSLTFLLWVPTLLHQPRDAVAWMHEPAAELVTGIASSFGGAGRIPPPFGPPLPGALVALGSRGRWRSRDARRWRSCRSGCGRSRSSRNGAAWRALQLGASLPSLSSRRSFFSRCTAFRPCARRSRRWSGSPVRATCSSRERTSTCPRGSTPTGESSA
jgi:hypothetical protein